MFENIQQNNIPDKDDAAFVTNVPDEIEEAENTNVLSTEIGGGGGGGDQQPVKKKVGRKSKKNI